MPKKKSVTQSSRSAARATAASVSKKKPPQRRIAPALRRNDERLVEAARAQVLAKSEEDMALIRSKITTIADAFFDIGQALGHLNHPAVLNVRKYASIGALSQKEFGISPTGAFELMSIANRLRRADADRWGREKSAAVVELAHGIDAHDVNVIKPKELQAALHNAVDLEKSDARALLDYAKQLRHKAQSGHALRGRTTTSHERLVAEVAQREAIKGGIATAKITVKASLPGQISNLDIRAVPVDRIGVLVTALHAAERAWRQGGDATARTTKRSKK